MVADGFLVADVTMMAHTPRKVAAIGGESLPKLALVDIHYLFDSSDFLGVCKKAI